MDNIGNKVHFKVVKKKENLSNEGTSTFLSGLGSILLIAVSIFLIYNIFKSVDLTVKKVAILNQAEQEVDDLRLKNISLILSREEVETDDYIETESRDRLNLAKEGELVFVISDELIERGVDIVNSLLSSNEETVHESNYQQWYRFLFGGRV